MVIAKDIVEFLQGVLSVFLIGVVAAQTTKSEGLTGSIGGQVTSSFKGKPGMDEQIKKLTVIVSASWFVVSIAAALLVRYASR